MFEKITAAPADPILGLTDDFKADPRTHKINLGVGIYKNEAGNTPILATVKKQKLFYLHKKQPNLILGFQEHLNMA